MTSGIDTATIALLQHKRIYFGHQSVGANIMDGVHMLCGNLAPGLKIVESSHPDAFTSPAFAHSRLGRNQDPRSKIDAFADVLGKDLGNQADVVFFKFCYVDVTDGSDVVTLFNYYAQVMAQLGTAWPRTRLMHVTVPVTVMPGLVRRLVGGLRGKRNRAACDNLARADYNRLLRETYAGKEPVFDLAAVESTSPSGRVLRYSLEGRELQTLVPAYSSDGRHLSESGRRVVATALLKTLTTVAGTQEVPAHE